MVCGCDGVTQSGVVVAVEQVIKEMLNQQNYPLQLLNNIYLKNSLNSLQLNHRSDDMYIHKHTCTCTVACMLT